MTRGLEDFLNLPHLEDTLPEAGLPDHETAAEPGGDAVVQRALTVAEMAEERLRQAEGRDHAEAMDEIHREALKNTRDLMDLGFNMDPARSARLFEVASMMMKNAIDAKNSKRNAQLKAVRMALDQRKLEIEERRAAGNGQMPVVESGGTVLIEDRNHLIRQIRAQARQDSVPPAAPD